MQKKRNGTSGQWEYKSGQPQAKVQAGSSRGRWIREKGFKADIARVRQEYPQLLTFAGWVKKYTDEH